MPLRTAWPHKCSYYFLKNRSRHIDVLQFGGELLEQLSSLTEEFVDKAGVSGFGRRGLLGGFFSWFGGSLARVLFSRSVDGLRDRESGLGDRHFDRLRDRGGRLRDWRGRLRGLS